MRFLILFFFNLLAFSAEKYFCPMHCEGAKTYEKAGTCPVCHMYLEKPSEPGAETGPLSLKDYRVDLKSKIIKTGEEQETEITLTPKYTQTDKALNSLENSEGIELEVYVTNQDLSFMEYVVPRKTDTHSFVFQQKFPKPQNALLFVIFKPKGERVQTFPLALKVETQGSQKILRQAPKKPLAVKTSESKTGFGYAVVVSEDTTYFKREHSALSDLLTLTQNEQFKKTLPKPGKYKVFIQKQGTKELTLHTLRK